MMKTSKVFLKSSEDVKPLLDFSYVVSGIRNHISVFKPKQTNVLRVDNLVSVRGEARRPRLKTAVGSKLAESNDARRSSS